MEALLELEGLALPARLSGSWRPLPGGLRLQGREVRILHPFGPTRFYRHGWQSWSPTGWVELGRPPQPVLPPQRRPQCDDPEYAESPRHGGSAVGALEGPEGRILLLGALDLGARVEADLDLLAGRCAEEIPWFLGWGPEEEVFARYAALLGQALGRGRFRQDRVWCSWYSYRKDISQERLQAVLEGMEDLPFSVFQVDDGWQRGIGDWEPNERFPEGMARLAQAIASRGLVPGLWLAPFVAAPGSRLAERHPDWLLRDPQGRPLPAGHNWGGPFFALDTTHPEVVGWLTDLFHRVLGWGYRYLKLDFVYAAALPGLRRAPLARERACREALRLVRRVCRDAYLLLCGAPVLPSLGLADGLRIGPDAAAYYDNPSATRWLHDRSRPGLRNALGTSLHRLWLRDLVQMDPDVAYFRTRYCLLGPGMRAMQRDLAWICGFRSTSDPPEWLDPPEREELRRFLSEAPEVERLGRYRFRLQGREVDFSAPPDPFAAPPVG